MKRVVVTGMGMVTPLGCGVTLNWERLINSQSGISAIERFDVSELSCKIGGQLPGGDGDGAFNADDWVPHKDQRKMGDFIIFAMATATQAVEDSGWKPTEASELERTGVIIGSGIGGVQKPRLVARASAEPTDVEEGYCEPQREAADRQSQECVRRDAVEVAQLAQCEEVRAEQDRDEDGGPVVHEEVLVSLP